MVWGILLGQLGVTAKNEKGDSFISTRHLLVTDIGSIFVSFGEDNGCNLAGGS